MLLKKHNPDYWTFLIILILLTFGIIMVFSASQYFAQYKPYNDSYYFLKKQLYNAVLGVIAMVVLMQFDYHNYHKMAFPMLCVGMVLVVSVFFIGDAAGGAVRWIDLGFVRFQPSELMKIALVVFLASSLNRRQAVLHKLKEGFIPYVILIGVVFGLVAMEDLSTAVIIAGTAWVMMFCAGNKPAHLFSLVLLGVVLIAVAIQMEGFRQGRITAFLDPWADPKGNGYQTIQSMVAIGSGGLTGVGLGAGGAKWYYLPDRHTDFIFSIIAEEMGLVGGIFVFLLFLAFTWRGLSIAWNSSDNFGSLLALGLTAMVSIQTLMNLGVALGCLPVTGITLPFISYGGTSLVISLGAIGILLNVSRYANLRR